jgi:hypothetical protein
VSFVGLEVPYDRTGTGELLDVPLEGGFEFLRPTSVFRSSRIGGYSALDYPLSEQFVEGLVGIFQVARFVGAGGWVERIEQPHFIGSLGPPGAEGRSTGSPGCVGVGTVFLPARVPDVAGVFVVDGVGEIV